MTSVTPTSFPRQHARTRRFTLGQPHELTVSADGARVAFLRSPGGADPVAGLWVLDVAAGSERLVADPTALLAGTAEALSAAERARRERARETGAGIVGFATDAGTAVAAFALSGRLFLADLVTGDVRELPAAGPVVDPRPSPDGRWVAYVSGRTLRVTAADGSGDREVVAEEDPEVSWGSAEFIAAEEMHRFRGFWWAPEGRRLLAARVDNSPVQRWHIADPAHPSLAATEIAYPAAGTPNAEVTLAVLDLAGGRVDVPLDPATLPYLVTASWQHGHDPLVVLQSRDQRRVQLWSVDPAVGTGTVLREDSDPCWVEVMQGVPRFLHDGRLVWLADDADTRRLLVDGAAVTPAGLQVLQVLDVGDEDVLLLATDEPTERHVYRWVDAGLERVSTAPGVHTAARGGGTLVLSSAGLERHGTTTTAYPSSGAALTLTSHAETPVLTPSVTLLRAGDRAVRTAVLLPTGHEPGQRLPVLLDPYGGPHAARVLSARSAFLVSQWFADQGFAVVVADGRGTPARGPAWERAIAEDWAGAVLEDQIDALHAAAKDNPDLDLDRVGIRGWSYGGYLAALAVLRRPDVFHAAVAGAPVTDWALYDTHYTERYLGLPQEQPKRYAAESLLADAARLERPLMLVHGLADDNVVAAHTLRLSTALLAAGRPHTVLPLSGVTHMTPQEEVAENLLLLQVEFLHRELARG